jgi:DNA adenine methylase
MTLFTKIPHPIPYQGSKRNLAAVILACAPTVIERLVEPFAGSAAISLAAAQRGIARRIWINDANGPLIDLWREILEHPVELAASYRALWEEQRGNERAYFDEVRHLFNREHRPDHFLYLLLRCVKGAIRYNSRGEFNNTPDNRRQGAHPDDVATRLQGASELLRGKTSLTSLDYREVLEKSRPGDLLYLDPPYQGVSTGRDSRYGPSVEHGEFRDTLERLVRSEALFIVSYDGRTGMQYYGTPLPERLGLTHLEIRAGRSTQATLLGKDRVTYESLYLSPALTAQKKVDRTAAEDHFNVSKT